ncbi:MAG: S8 family serine peptidase [Caulobacteraceae bacterium]|nr:S8 family serine peptidase [Caulobacteraceae bacterium]
MTGKTLPSMWRRLALTAAAWAATAGLAAFPGPAQAVQPDEGQKVLVMLRLPPEHPRAQSDYGGGYGDGMARSASRRIATRLARQNGLSLVEDWPMPMLGVDCFVLSVPAGRSPGEVAQRLSLEPQVAWSQPVNLYRAEAASLPPLFLAQPAAKEWRLAELHRVVLGRGVRVAVIDSMVDRDHPDLAGQVQTLQNFVPGRPDAGEQHGTAVAGVIAAKGVRVAGVAPGVRLMALRACWQSPGGPPGSSSEVCDTLSLARALDFAVSHAAQVINLSLGGPSDLLLGKLLDVALARRIVVVAAFDPDLPGGGFPASHPGVIAVADEGAGPAPAGVYSAPGEGVPTTIPGARWGLVNGSSFAAAHVSGLFALMRERHPAAATPLRLATARSSGVIDACATLLGQARVCQDARAKINEASAAARP